MRFDNFKYLLKGASDEEEKDGECSIRQMKDMLAEAKSEEEAFPCGAAKEGAEKVLKKKSLRCFLNSSLAAILPICMSAVVMAAKMAAPMRKTRAKNAVVRDIFFLLPFLAGVFARAAFFACLLFEYRHSLKDARGHE